MPRNITKEQKEEILKGNDDNSTQLERIELLVHETLGENVEIFGFEANCINVNREDLLTLLIKVANVETQIAKKELKKKISTYVNGAFI